MFRGEPVGTGWFPDRSQICMLNFLIYSQCRTHSPFDPKGVLARLFLIYLPMASHLPKTSSLRSRLRAHRQIIGS